MAIIATSPQNEQDSSSDDGMELSGVRTSRSGSSSRRSHLPNGVMENGHETGMEVEMAISQCGPEIASVNHKELLRFCKALLRRTEE